MPIRPMQPHVLGVLYARQIILDIFISAFIKYLIT